MGDRGRDAAPAESAARWTLSVLTRRARQGTSRAVRLAPMAHGQATTLVDSTSPAQHGSDHPERLTRPGRTRKSQQHGRRRSLVAGSVDGWVGSIEVKSPRHSAEPVPVSHAAP